MVTRTYRMKIMIVGQENVGKTSLAQCLKADKWKTLKRGTKKVKNSAEFGADVHPPKPPSTIATDGIDIDDWVLSVAFPSSEPKTPFVTHDVTLSVWDFAGQELYYTTHQFFLSERSLYLVVFNLAHPEQSHVAFWLQSIKAMAPNSPIVIVGTHSDDKKCSEKYLRAVHQWLINKYSAQFPTIKAICFVSCSTSRNFDTLYQKIQDILSQQPHMGTVLPKNYMELERIIMKERESRVPPIVTWEEYTSMATLCLITQPQDLNTATTLLHNLGSLVYFGSDPKLRKMVILDPRWLQHMMSTVISIKTSFIRDGILKHSILPHIWKPPEYPLHLHGYILSILEKFEIMFQLTDSKFISDETNNTNPNNNNNETQPQDTTTPPPPPTSEPMSLFPSLLPERPPKNLDTLWPTKKSQKQSQFGRSYLFDFLPKGFFGRLMIRMISFPIRVLSYWRYGMLCQMGQEIILLTINQQSQTLDILVRTELEGTECYYFSWLVFSCVDSLVTEWYQLVAKVSVICSHCMDAGCLDPFLFPLQECQASASLAGKSFLMCQHTNQQGQPADCPVRLDTMAPDLAMVHLEARKINSSELTKEGVIGEGGYAIVYRGTWQGKKVAIKELKIDDQGLTSEEGFEAQQKMLESFRHEVWIMSGLSHPNLVMLMGFSMSPCTIVTELMEEGSLYDYLHAPSREGETSTDWPLCLKIAHDIAKGCAFLHSTSPPVIHRDLKSPNILLASLDKDADVVAKVADFGVSLNASDYVSGRKVDCPVWLAPEVMQSKPYTAKADVYGAGVIFWEIVTRQNFFGETSFLSVIEEKVLSGERPAIPADCLPPYASLITDMWHQDPEKRPFFPEIATRLKKMMEEYYPEIANYDAGVATKFQIEKMKEIERKLTLAAAVKEGETETETETEKAKESNTAESKKEEEGDNNSSKAPEASSTSENENKTEVLTEKKEEDHSFEQFQTKFLEKTSSQNVWFSGPDPARMENVQKMVNRLSMQIMGPHMRQQGDSRPSGLKRSQQHIPISPLSMASSLSPSKPIKEEKQKDKEAKRKDNTAEGDDKKKENENETEKEKRKEQETENEKEKEQESDEAILDAMPRGEWKQQGTWNRQLGALIGQFVLSHTRGQSDFIDHLRRSNEGIDGEEDEDGDDDDDDDDDGEGKASPPPQRKGRYGHDAPPPSPVDILRKEAKALRRQEKKQRREEKLKREEQKLKEEADKRAYLQRQRSVTTGGLLIPNPDDILHPPSPHMATLTTGRRASVDLTTWNMARFSGDRQRKGAAWLGVSKQSQLQQEKEVRKQKVEELKEKMASENSNNNSARRSRRTPRLMKPLDLTGEQEKEKEKENENEQEEEEEEDKSKKAKGDEKEGSV